MKMPPILLFLLFPLILFGQEKNIYENLLAYGGWCAYAKLKGREVDINPKAYHIQQGQLHLFYKTNWVDTLAKWLKDEVTYKTKADKVWAKKLVQNN